MPWSGLSPNLVPSHSPTPHTSTTQTFSSLSSRSVSRTFHHQILEINFFRLICPLPWVPSERVMGGSRKKAGNIPHPTLDYGGGVKMEETYEIMKST
jgi:hypothetical protein